MRKVDSSVFRVRRVSLVLATAVAALSAASVSAQTAEAPSPAPPAADQANAGIVPDVVVTAQRREESLQRVPLSIVAIGRDALAKDDVTEVYRLQQVAPGLSLGKSGSDPRPAARGIYTEAIQGNNDPRFGFYVDEVYQSRTSQLDMPFVDLDRVEVQLGPQGTLYGRNSFGGNIAITTAKPTDHVEGGVDITAGTYNRVAASAYVNLPLADGLAVRVAGYAETRDGYVRSTISPDADQDDKRQQYVRGELRWAPPALGDRLEVLLRGTYWHENDNGDGAFSAKAIGQFVDPSLIVAPGGTATIGGYTFTFPNGYNGRTFTGQLYPYGTFRNGQPQFQGANLGYPVLGPYTVISNAPSLERVSLKQFSGTINFDVTDHIRFRSITAYTDYNAVRTTDYDGTPADYGIGYFLTRDKAFSQELQIQSIGNSPLKYTIGGYYLNDIVPDAYVNIFNRTYSTANALATGGYPLYGGSSFTYLPNATLPANTSDAYNPLSRGKTLSYAGYGQASYTIANKLTLTGGVRYTIETKELRSALTNPTRPAIGAGTYLVFQPTTDFNIACNGITAADPSSTATAAAAAALITRCGRRTFHYVTYRGAVDYQLSDAILLYASYSTGKHSGGFSYSPLPFGDTTVLPPVDTESVKAIEAGFKSSFFERRLQINVAGYYNQYSNLQVQTSYPNPAVVGSTVTVAGNGAKAKAPGVDVSITARPTPRLTLSFSANYLHSRQDPYPTAAGSSGFCSIVLTTGTGNPCAATTNANGSTNVVAFNYGYSGGTTPNPYTNPNLFVAVRDATTGAIIGYNSLQYNVPTRIQNVPDITLQGDLAYEIDLGRAGSLTPEVQPYFNGGYILSPALINFQQKSFTKTDLRVTWRTPDRKLSVQAFVQNVEDRATVGRVTVGSVGVSGTYAAPRTAGAKLSYRY